MTNIFIITGQTGTGKTKLAVKYAKKYKGQVINCDSRQIYKYLDIITGKDKPAKNKIWLYDVVDPHEHFSSYDYVKLAVPLIHKLREKNITPIIVGGTYLYLKHLLYGFGTENIPPNWQLRKKLGTKQIAFLQKILKKTSLQLFNQLNQSDINNPQRLIRKIEIAQSGKSAKSINSNRLRLKLLPAEIEFIGLRFKDKDKLRTAIEKRVEERLEKGAIDEVKALLKKGYSETDPGLNTIGYKEIISYLKGKIAKQEAVTQWKNKEIQYAKRQYTFMKKDPQIHWIEL